tara:strand:+ start:69 stop:953 length:885 start_codon:yes stop_codon:yes gene_type:complete
MKIDSNTVVLITGGAQGLGLATAKYLASKEAKICIIDLDEELLKSAKNFIITAAECAADVRYPHAATSEGWFNDDVEYMVCDVSIPEQVEVAINKCVTKFGKIDAVISCAGIAAYSCTYNEALNLELDLDICKNTMNVNYFGSLHLAKYASKAMAKNTHNERGERGVICFTSSVCATEGLQMSLPYSTSKAAINGMVLPMTRDLSHLGIRVNSINAGTFPTNMQINGIKAGYGVNDEEGIKKFQKEFIDRYYPPETYDNLGQGQVEDFGHFVASIIENPFMNGSVLRFDGGMRM